MDTKCRPPNCTNQNIKHGATIPFKPPNSTRKQRVVKNPDVETHNVLDPPGDNYINWINITKQKLTERESKIMTRRTNVMQNIFTQEFDSIKNTIKKHAPDFHIDSLKYNNIINNNQSLIKSCLKRIKQFTYSWKGVNLIYMKKPPKTFKKYFSVGKSWLDQGKRRILARDLWIALFKLILNVINSIATKCFNQLILQQTFRMTLFSKICLRTFQATYTCPASKPQPLISLSIFKSCKFFQCYLIENIVNIDAELFKPSSRVAAKDLYHNIINELRTQYIQSMKSFENQLIMLTGGMNVESSKTAELKTENNNIGGDYHNIQVRFVDNNINNNRCERIYAGEIIKNLHVPRPNVQNNAFYSGYNGHHASTHTVSDQRFQPCQSAMMNGQCQRNNIQICTTPNQSLLSMLITSLINMIGQ